MIRHARQHKIVNRDNPNFDEILNKAIDSINNNLPNDWQIILDYIDSESLLLNTSGLSDNQLIRMTERKQGVASVFYRLARLFAK